jgi:hypothetical protein
VYVKRFNCPRAEDVHPKAAKRAQVRIHPATTRESGGRMCPVIGEGDVLVTSSCKKRAVLSIHVFS